MIKEKNYDFRKRMAEIHKPHIQNSGAICRDNQYEIKNGFVISIPELCDSVVLTAAKDFTDFMLISMNVSVRICEGDQENANIVLLPEPKDLKEANGYKGYRIDISEKIEISAFDSRGAAQAFYRLEDMMAFEKAPFIEKGTIFNRPLFSPQMVHSGFGLDMYPDNHLSQIAHQGRDAILVFVKDLYITPYGYLDFNDLVYRAEKYGIDVYAYSYIPCSKHPDDKDAEAYYESTYGKLFKNCPGIKGLILVGESMYFPSKDKACLPSGDPKKPPILSRNYPCEDYPQLLNMIKNTVRKYNKNTDIVFWTYNWGFIEEEKRVKLIENLPKDITLLATFEMFEEYPLGNSTQFCSDYTISRTGPGDYFKSEAIAAKKNGIKLYTMSNTAGRTWDFGVIPYVPCPYQWMKRFNLLREANENWELCGLMESHHYGIFPSFISELSKWSFSTEKIDAENILEKIIARDYGEENINAVKQALKLWSEAITYCTPTIEDQYGPLRIGPSYPLCFDMEETAPSVPYAHFGMRICRTLYPAKNYHHSSFSSIRIKDELNALEKMCSLMEEGISILHNISAKTDELERLIALGSYIKASAKTTANVKRWNIKKCALLSEGEREKALCLVEELQNIATEEIENAKSILWATEIDSCLGWEPSMEYLGDAEHILWKINQVQKIRDSRLEEFKVCLKK